MFSLSLVYLCAWTVLADASVVVTSAGPVRGKLLEDDGVFYYAYQGIPYAESPTGELRFKPPVPKQPWSEILDATEPGPACPQPEGRVKKDDMNEDCLNVNVFVPANATQKIMPVFVYFHGGAFKMNSGNIDFMCGPQLLLKREIIYVSMNYRLGALGYLSFKTEEASGNAGLKDLLLALKWVKMNIHKFGGSTITIGGQSSGAAMVHYMLLSEKTTALFDRAILISGSATNYRFLSRYPRTHAFALAKELGFSEYSEDKIIENLRNASIFDIIDAQENMYKNTRNIMSPFAPFVPCIENKSDLAILTQDPREIIETGLPQDVPIIVGINSREGAYMWSTLHTKSTSFLQQQFPMAIPGDIEYPSDSAMYKDLVNSISELYFGDKNLSNFTLTNFYDLISDTQYTYSVGSWIKNYKQNKESNRLYYYLFNFEGDLNWAKITYNIPIPGVAHTDEIGYIFVNQATRENLKNLNPDSKTHQTLENMLTLVSGFIKFGNPTPAESECGAAWPEYGAQGRHLVINERHARVLTEPFADRFAFWANVYEQYHQYVQNGGARETKIPQ